MREPTARDVFAHPLFWTLLGNRQQFSAIRRAEMAKDVWQKMKRPPCARVLRITIFRHKFFANLEMSLT